MNRKLKLNPHIYMNTCMHQHTRPTKNTQQLNMHSRSLSKRFSKFCRKFVNPNIEKTSISYPQQVRSSAPISNGRPTSAEERPLSRSSFTCPGLTKEFWQPELEPGCERRYYVPINERTSGWVAQPRASRRTDELCSVCDRQPVQDGIGICSRCKFSLGLGILCGANVAGDRYPFEY